MKALKKLESVIFPIIGIICVLGAEHIVWLLPYLLGGAMMAVGALMGIGYFQDKRFLNQNSEELVYGIVMLIMGLAFIIQGPNALVPIGTTWAIIGIRKAAKSLNQAIRQIYLKQHFAVPVLTFAVRIALALLLLFDPHGKFSSHVVILGLELIATSIKLKKEFLSVKDENQ